MNNRHHLRNRYKTGPSIFVLTVTFLSAVLLLSACGHTSESFPASEEETPQIEEQLPVELPEIFVSIGGTEYPSDSESICPENTDFDELKNALSEFSSLKTLDLRLVSLSGDEISRLLDSFPDIGMTYTVSLLGTDYAQDTEMIDLSAAVEEDAEELISALKLLPDLKSVKLSGPEEENGLALETIFAIHEAAPLSAFDCRCSIFGKTINLSDSELTYAKADIGDNGLQIFYELLPCMVNLNRLVLDNCGTTNEAMTALRDDFPEKSVVWRIRWGHFSVLTDVEVIRAVGTESNAETDALKYCTNVRFIDMGHSEKLTNIEFTRYMPKLQLLIVADSAITSIEPLSECKELMMLEIVNCWDLRSIDALSNCPKLRFLNFSNSFKVKDLSPIYELTNLERVFASGYSVPDSQFEELKGLHPDCWVSYGSPPASGVSKNYSIGWRLDDAPKVFADWYIELRKVFGIGYDLYDEMGYYSYENVRPYDFPLDELQIFVLDQ